MNQSLLCCLTTWVVASCSVATGLVWGVVWAVLTVVQDDIASNLNWYFMMVLRWTKLHDVFNLLRIVHFLLFALTVFIVYWLRGRRRIKRSRVIIAQFVLLGIVCYNGGMMIWLVRSGGMVFSLLLLAFPLSLTLLLFRLLLPLVLLLLMLAVYLLSYRSPFTWSSLTRSSRLSRLVLLLVAHSVVLCVLLWNVNKACQACASLHLPRRPSLTAHRGCSLDYPENSEVAFQRAVSIPSVTTLETDVQVSSDGELFLLHDPHLARTTAVATSCPSVNPLHIASQLGYHTGTCTLSSLPLLQDCSQHVPLFKHFLRTAATAGVNIVFDLYRPPAGHAHEKDYVNLTLETILQSGMVLSKVWFLTRACQTSSECIVLKALEGGRGGGEEPVISAGFPALTRVSKTSQTKLDQFVALGITIANEEWSTSLDTLRMLQSRNISINMYTVNSDLLFDYSWCVGVSSVTTDNCWLLNGHTHNYLFEACSLAPWSLFLLTILSMACWLLHWIRAPLTTDKKD